MQAQCDLAEAVEIDLVASDKVGMGEAPEAAGLGSLMPPGRFVVGDEIVEIGRSFDVKRWFVRRS